MPYLVRTQAELEHHGVTTGDKVNSTSRALSIALDYLEADGWRLEHLVQHSKNQIATKYIFHKE